jgi:superfamily I DNA/RNA helicase
LPRLCASRAASCRLYLTFLEEVPVKPRKRARPAKIQFKNRLKMLSLLAIYPTAYKVEDLLKRRSQANGILLGHRITTFPQLIDILWRETAGAQVSIGSFAEGLALEEAITRVLRRGVRLPFAAGAGLRDHLLSFIRELKSAAIDARDLQYACAGLPDTVGSRLTPIAEIFAEYDKLLQHCGAVDAHDRERLVVEWLHRMENMGQQPRILNGVQRLLVAEVYDPSLLQFMLVSSLIRLIGDATLTIQAEPFDLRLSRFAELTWNRFVAEESLGDKVLPDFVRREGRQGRLGFVLTHLFSSAASPTPASHRQLAFSFLETESKVADLAGTAPPPDGTVRIIEAPNARREAEEVARAIRKVLELPAGEQVALDRIAVVARNLAIYSEHLERAFRIYRIPLKLLQRRSLSTFAPARVVRDILRIPQQDYHRDNLVGLCRASFLSFAATHHQELLAEVGYIDRRTGSLAECIKSRRDEMLGVLEQTANWAQIEKLRHRLVHFDQAARAWTELLELLAQLEPPTTLGEHVIKTFNVLARLGFDPTRDALSDSAAAAAGPLRSALEMLANDAQIVAPGRQATLGEFTSLVERLLDETMVEPLAEHLAGGVRAMAVADARGLDFDLVFIIGLNDGIFPSHHFEDPLISDDSIRKLNQPLRRALRRMGRFAPDSPGPILRTHVDRNAEEPFLFFLAMSMPARSVVLSYSAADASGNPLAVSPFVAEVSRILNGATPELVGSAEFIPSLSDCFAASEFLGRAALDSLLLEPVGSHLADSVEIDSILRRTEVERRRDRYLALPSREELVAARRRQSEQRDHEWLAVDLSPDTEKLTNASAYDGRVTVTPALVRFLTSKPEGAPREWSASQLTDLAACGYKFFARRILRLREPEQADYEQTALETGSLIHQILNGIFSQAEPSNQASLRASARRMLDEFHRREHFTARDPAFFEIEWISIEAMVFEIIEHEIARLATGEIPSQMYHEFPLKFVLPRRAGPAGVQAPEFVMVGKIDRLELYRKDGLIQRFKLIDYKTSHRLDHYAERLKSGYFACEDLQMPVYALGAAEHFRSELSSQAEVEVSYIALKSRAKASEPQQIPRTLVETAGHKTIASRILDLVASAIAGRFDVDPLECSAYCSYRRVCRYRKPFSD